LDRDLESAKEGPAFPSVLLREAVNLGKGYLADSNGSRTKEYFKCFQLFDESKETWKAGNGHLFAADGYRAFYFYSPEFEGKSLNVHTLRTALLTSFLSKSKGDIQIRRSDRSSYLVNKDNQVVGWSDPVSEHELFSYYPHSKDSYVLRIRQGVILKALNYMRAELDAKRDKVRVQYVAEKGTLQFLASENGKDIFSAPISVVPLSPEDGTVDFPIRGGEKSKTEDFTCNLNLNHFIDLFAPAKNNEVELRIGIAKGSSFLIRTIDSFHMDTDGKVVVPSEGEKTYSCRVTRFISNKK
jgi:hypothetical protein